MLALLGGKPVSNSNSDPAYSLYSSNSSRQFRTEEARVGSFKSNPAHGSQPEVDGRWRVLLLFEIDPTAQHYGAVEREPRLGAVPVNEVGDCSVISTLAALER